MTWLGGASITIDDVVWSAIVTSSSWASARAADGRGEGSASLSDHRGAARR
jgi:hypothetical protein